ncbi:MAG: hypothetical protein OXP74_01865 [Acidobacteriota bacterium]|nr:hypothetical protein [Acidobacteriota bacterium]
MSNRSQPPVQRAQSGMAPTPTAHEAAARIRALHMTARMFAQLIEAQIMEALWVIRCELPVDADFCAFVESQTPIDRNRALLMVETWAVARRRRELRELAQRQPSEALSLMQSAIDAGVQLADATDRQVAELLSRPPRQRNRAIRELIDSHQSKEQAQAAGSTQGADPTTETVEPVPKHPNRRFTGFLEALQAIESELADLLLTAEMVLGSGNAMPEAGRERLLSLAAIATDHIERINHLALSCRLPSQTPPSE